MPRTPQPLHIFRKDVLHLWPETAVVLLLFAAFVWAAPSRWTGSEYAGTIGVLAFFLKAFLMPISWLVVISRLIQDEPLVGDRQFWTSRPYHWPSLIAAKALYLLVFLYLPFLLMQVFLLKHAGLYPTTAIGPLLHNLLLLTVVVVVPIAAISAVTSTFPRALLAFIGAVIYLIVVALLIVWIVFSHMPPPGIDDAATYLFVLLPLGALVFQYATRRTGLARTILIATPAVIALLFLVPAGPLIQHFYPAASEPKLGQLPDEFAPKTPREGSLAVLRGRVLLGLPVTISGGDEDAHYSIAGIDTTISAMGVHFHSGFKTPSESTSLSAGIPFSIVPVVLPVDVFNNTGHVPADVHLALAVNQLKVDKPSTWKATAKSFSVPGNGVCTFPADNPDAAPTCVYPFKQPEFSAVSAPLSASCADPNAPKMVEQADLSGKVNLLDFDPVISTPMNFQSRQQQGGGYVLCPGTALTFVGAHDAGKSRLDVDLKQLILENYATHFADRAPRGAAPPAEP